MKTLSIKLKAAIAATIGAVALILLFSAAQRHFVREDLATVLTDTQFALVSRVAAEIDDKLALHLDMLTRYAAATPRDVLRSPRAVRENFNRRPLILALFDSVVLFAPDGKAIADVPEIPGRTKMIIADRPYFQEVLRTRKPLISEPIISSFSKAPMVIMAAPLLASDGSVLAVVTGTLKLNEPNFLGGLATAKAGKTGYFFILSKGPNPIYVVHPDRNRMSQPRPSGLHGAADGALEGFEGSREEVSSSGMRGLYSFKSLHMTNWILGAVIPSEEAFAPIAEAERRILLAPAVAALLVAPLVWLVVCWLLSPLTVLRDTIHRLHTGDAAFVPVPVARYDEAGDLAESFNRLMGAREVTDSKLRESENRLRMIADNMPALIAYLDRHLRFRFTNKAYSDWFELEPDHLLGRSVREFVGDTRFAEIQPMLDDALHGKRVIFESVMQTPAGKRMVEVTLVPHGSGEEAAAGVYTLIHDTTRQKEVENMLRQLARVDSLTQMPNRHSFEEHLTEAIARSERTRTVLALMFLDIDHFKAINDNHGHEAGDEVLREFARRLSQAVRATDTAARLAGDEFVVILEGLRDASEAEIVAGKILAALESEFRVRDAAIKVSSSIGIAVRSQGQVDAGELLREADTALYAAKREGRNRFYLAAPGSAASSLAAA